jgi:thioredoxin 1
MLSLWYGLNSFRNPGARGFYFHDNLQFNDNLVETINVKTNTGTRNIMSEHIVHVTDSTFEDEVLKSETPVLVDYWAEWCGPCRAIAPVLEEIAEEYSGKLIIAKIDVDSNQSTPQKYAVRGIPTLMIFKNGNVIGTKVGAASKSQLSAFIDSTI